MRDYVKLMIKNKKYKCVISMSKRDILVKIMYLHYVNFSQDKRL